MDIRTAHNWQDLEMIRAHPLKCQVQALVGVHVREVNIIDKITKRRVTGPEISLQ